MANLKINPGTFPQGMKPRRKTINAIYSGGKATKHSRRCWINRFLNKESATAAGGEALNDLLISFKGQPILLMLSGGSALGLLDYISPSSLGENLTISALDERYSQDSDTNNFSQIQHLDFFMDAGEKDASFIGTLPRPNESAVDLAKRWEAALQKWRSDFPTGKIIATFGMGADGHTAGIFPFPEDLNKFKQLFEKENWVVAFDAGSKNKFSRRITTTLTFFKQIDEAIILVCGQEKKEKLDEVLTKASSPAELPAMAWYDLENAQIFTDI